MKWRVLGVALVVIVVAVGAMVVFQHGHRPSLQQATVELQPTVPPPAGHDDTMVVFFSGDGGWRDLDQQMGKRLAARGLPVLGISCLDYYWHARTPEETARELDAMISKYSAQWHKSKVWIIGFSFGADVLPTIVNKLSPANRAKLVQLVQLSPSTDVNFEIAMEDYIVARENWFKTHIEEIVQAFHPIPHYPALPQIEAINNQPPMVCYYGKEEGKDSPDGDDTICDSPQLPSWVKVHEMPGDHHFNYQYDALATQLISELPADSAAH